MEWLEIQRPAAVGRRPVLVHVPHAGVEVPRMIGMVADED